MLRAHIIFDNIIIMTLLIVLEQLAILCKNREIIIIIFFKEKRFVPKPTAEIRHPVGHHVIIYIFRSVNIRKHFYETKPNDNTIYIQVSTYIVVIPILTFKVAFACPRGVVLYTYILLCVMYRYVSPSNAKTQKSNQPNVKVGLSL